MDAVWNTLWAWIGQWGTHSTLTHLTHALSGLLGGSLYSVILTPELHMPKYNRATHTLKLGLAGNLLVGLICGFIANHSVPISFAGGLIGLPMISQGITKGIPALWKGFIGWAADQISKEKSQ